MDPWKITVGVVAMLLGSSIPSLPVCAKNDKSAEAASATALAAPATISPYFYGYASSYAPGPSSPYFYGHGYSPSSGYTSTAPVYPSAPGYYVPAADLSVRSSCGSPAAAFGRSYLCQSAGASGAGYWQ
jgi:hypothetical protein